MLKRLPGSYYSGILLALCQLPVLAMEPQPEVPESLREQVKEITDYYQSVQQHTGNSLPHTHAAANSGAVREPAQRSAAVQLTGQSRVQPSFSSANQFQGRAFSSQGRDPFAVTYMMLQLQGKPVSDVNFTQIENVAVPTMRLRGLIDNSKEQQLAALMEVDGLGVFVVREGDTIGLQGVGSNSVLRIVQISNLSLVVEAGHVGQRFIVR